jgi:hypothetical protein
VEETISKVFNQNTHQKNVGTFQFKMQIKKNIMKYVGISKIFRIKSSYSNANAAIRGDYYFLSIYIVSNKICIYVKILALLITDALSQYTCRGGMFKIFLHQTLCCSWLQLQNFENP